MLKNREELDEASQVLFSEVLYKVKLPKTWIKREGGGEWGC